MKKIISLILVLLLSVMIFVACKPSDEDPQNTPVDPPTTTVPPETPPTQGEEKKIKLTLHLYNETKTVELAESGEYTLEPPSRVGFEFMGWKTTDGQDFLPSGTVTTDTVVTAQWKVLNTSTFAQLKERIEAGADTILLTGDITITDTVYVVSDTTIIADAPVTLTRGSEFLGDMFVIGETPNGENVVVLNRKIASLSLKPNNTTLCVDGGQIAANGTAFFIANTSTLNMHDGVRVQNHLKLGNDHLTVERDYNVSYPEKVGGSAVLITSGTFNMYGGVISNCNASTTDSGNSFHGGAIYNFGNFHMYGGSIEGNTAARGAAIYNYRTAKIYAGTIKDNYATAYGGVMYMPNSQYTYCVIGSKGTELDVKIIRNGAKKSGGAIFASHQSATEILGRTLFADNTSESNGGAINMAGALTVNYAMFTNNSASSKGGAIYAYYGDAEYSTRIINIKSGIFLSNTAPRGGAIVFYGNDEVDPPKGAIGYIGNVYFMHNSAPKNSSDKYGNGGAIYAALSSTVSVSKEAFFYGNSAGDEVSANIYETSNAKVTVEGSADHV